VISIHLHPAARRETRRAFDWYLQEAGPHIAAGFLDDFEHTLALLKNHPEIGETGGSNTRRLTFQRYPYTVVYRLKGETLEIVATAHHSRHPEYWVGRR
jgi:plasmid stabilization system protein ParE